MDPKMDPKMDTRKISAQRLPPPVLFQGPPSHNASNLSLPPPVSAVPSTGVSPRPPLQRNRSSRAGTLEAPGSLSPFLTRKQSKGEVDGSEAIWQEMQSALSEVELSAATGEHVFGEKHSEALEDLRTKQLKLAQAWARSEAGDESNASLRPASRSTAGPGDSANPEDGSSRNLDEETEKDILLARERREANDRYFDRVNNGVLDVVAKLEEVAQAMRAVERESKDIWSDTDSMSATTQTTTDTG
ncbi:cwf18 pre-mRNA splicing factor family protein [Aspergillus niger]|uniref:Cwf18 pre-mRNA splicing factor family protein n=1 Tax=Aspergillus niger TaxID=5061 RepID=A0A505HQ19_ASPNG|nr:cwf18 pre-mRNA splicing factor family protein [Aspergillus niger]